jgi:hypothetical protein
VPGQYGKTPDTSRLLTFGMLSATPTRSGGWPPMADEEWHEARVAVTDEQMSTWHVGRGLLATGKCPRCTDDAGVDIQLEGTIAIAGAEPVENVDAPYMMRCNCDASHRRRPIRRQGCGAWWIARVKSEGSGYVLRAEPDEELRRAAQAVGEGVEQAREGMTAAAEKWIPAISALTGLFGLASVVIARDAVTALSFGWRLIAYTLVCLAVAGAMGAIVLAYRAAYGWPRQVSFRSTGDLLAAAQALEERTAAAASRLRGAVLVALGSVVALLVALGILWLRPVTPSGPFAEVSFVQDGRSDSPASRCGQLLGAENRTLRLKVTSGDSSETVRVPLGDTTAMKVNARCKER